MSRRAFVIVLDACGVGALPDAAAYGDEGANTLGHLAQALGGLDLPTLGALGLGSILPLEGVAPAARPGVHGRLHALGPGKDSTSGHWELMGVVAEQAPPTYPRGFPEELVAELEQIAGRGFLCARPYDGIAAIDDFGEQHLRSGRLIVYTSQDSVLQVAAHVDVVAEEELIAICRDLRAALRPPHALGRVIARPFAGPPGAFERTSGRRDFALAPPARSYLDALREAGAPVHAVGKVADLFAGRGVDETHPCKTNADALARTERLVAEMEAGLCFVNLVETDQLHGHRKDREGFAEALREVDAAVARWLPALGGDDLLVLTADHGVDMDAAHSDHTREYAPLLATTGGAAAPGRRHDGPLADVGATALQWLAGATDPGLPGQPFLG